MFKWVANRKSKNKGIVLLLPCKKFWQLCERLFTCVQYIWQCQIHVSSPCVYANRNKFCRFRKVSIFRLPNFCGHCWFTLSYLVLSSLATSMMMRTIFWKQKWVLPLANQQEQYACNLLLVHKHYGDLSNELASISRVTITCNQSIKLSV